MTDNSYPDDYAHIHAPRTAVEAARDQKENIGEDGIEWGEWLRLAVNTLGGTE